MKAKKTALPRRRISFAVDRDEIEINSDWVDAVMSPSTPAVVSFPAPATPSQPDDGVFFVSEAKNATGADSTTGAECTSVENSAAVDNSSAVVQDTAVENGPPVKFSTTVALSATVVEDATVEAAPNPRPTPTDRTLAVEYTATVETLATGEQFTTGERFPSAKDHRIPRPRPILRVTDGLTPGQYAVYSLMYQAGEGTGVESRIYKGGYADLGRLTGLSKRGIQNIIAELQAKQVIRIHQQPGYHRTETTAYLVPDAESVLQAWFAQGWRHALGKSKTLVS